MIPPTILIAPYCTECTQFGDKETIKILAARLLKKTLHAQSMQAGDASQLICVEYVQHISSLHHRHRLAVAVVVDQHLVPQAAQVPGG